MFDLLYLTSLRKEGKSRALPHAELQSVAASESVAQTPSAQTPVAQTPVELEAVSVEALSESDVASSLGELTQKAGLLEWNNHMTWCNRTLKKEVVELEKIQEHADNGKLVPPLLC